MRPDAFHARVRAGYLGIAKREPGRVKVIEVQDSKDATQAIIREIARKCLLKR